MRLKRTYSEITNLAASKGLQIFIGEKRSDYYNLLAVDGNIIYECNIPKNGDADQIDFESRFLSSSTEKINEHPDWDDLVTTFPSSTSELFTYKKNSVVVQTVLVTYSDPSKKTITRLQKTRY